MGTIFEELVRRFNEKNNEEAGEHWTPRDAVDLMARLVFLPVADAIKSSTYLLYDGACGTGGMLTVAEKPFKALPKSVISRYPSISMDRKSTPKHMPSAKPTCYSKERAMRRTISLAGPSIPRFLMMPFPSHEFDFMLSNPPYGKELERAIRSAWEARKTSKTRAS